MNNTEVEVFERLCSEDGTRMKDDCGNKAR
jgi:hypothetical protein